jgi:NAD(P)-dependent dehydrogenase (short-subunit alcohol dehydrogenase family)
MTALNGRSAIITGAAQGLGRAFAEALAAEGADVTLCDEQASVSDVAAAIGPRALGLVADVSKRVDVERVIATAASAFGGIDILVNNAGRWRRTPVTDPFDKALTDWDYVMDTNLRGVLMLSRACVPHLIRRGGGDIVHVSTYYVLPARSRGTNSPETDLYNASKWALNGFTQAWALALAPQKVRVNALCMGATDTPMLRGLWPGEPPPGSVETWMQPADIANQLIELLAEGTEGRTGENIGAWVGEPVELGPRKPAHRRITG